MMVGLLNDRMYFFAAIDGICEVYTMSFFAKDANMSEYIFISGYIVQVERFERMIWIRYLH